MPSNSTENISTIIIKLPRGKVEIIERLKVEDNDEDIDIQTLEVCNNFQPSDYDENVESKLEIYESDIMVKEETIETTQEWEEINKKPSIDEIVEENINVQDFNDDDDQNTEFEYEDDEDADQDWQPIENNKKRCMVRTEFEEYVGSDYSKEDQNRDLFESQTIRTSKTKISKIAKGQRDKSVIQEINSQSIKFEYQCSYCDKSFPLEVTRKRHEKRWHRNSVQSCQHCPYKTTTSFLLRKHMYLTHGQLILECPLCNICFPSLEVLRAHSDRAHNTGAHMCDKCHKVYTLESYVKSHQKHCCTKMKVILNCEECGKVFATKCTLETHLEHHMGIKYECKECHEVFEWARSLYRHKEMKHQGKTYSCNECERDFSDDRGLAKHLKLVHNAKGGMPAKYECTMCPNKYWQKITLARHIKNYHCQPGDSLITVGEKICQYSKRNSRHKEFSCDICGKSYERKDNMRDHLRSFHYGINYSCHICPNTYTFADSFRKHMRDHRTGKTIRDCRVQKTYGNVTKNIDQNAKSHKCSICFVTYKSSKYFKKHIEAHMNLKNPLICSQCDIVFVSRNHLKQHVSSVHCPSTMYYTCSYCRKSFKYKKHLSYHIQGYHFLSVNVDSINPVKVENILPTTVLQ